MSTLEAKTTEAGRKTISLNFSGTPAIRLPELAGVIVPKRGKVSIGQQVVVVRKPQRLKPRNTRTEEDIFSGQCGGSQHHIRRPKK